MLELFTSAELIPLVMVAHGCQQYLVCAVSIARIKPSMLTLIFPNLGRKLFFHSQCRDKNSELHLPIKTSPLNRMTHLKYLYPFQLVTMFILCLLARVTFNLNQNRRL